MSKLAVQLSTSQDEVAITTRSGLALTADRLVATMRPLRTAQLAATTEQILSGRYDRL